MSQEKFRRSARWRLPSGMYDPVVSADGRRWRDYERAAEASGPMAERRLEERRPQGRIPALLNGAANGLSSSHGLNGTDGMGGSRCDDLFAGKIKTADVAAGETHGTGGIVPGDEPVHEPADACELSTGQPDGRHEPAVDRAEDRVENQIEALDSDEAVVDHRAAEASEPASEMDGAFGSDSQAVLPGSGVVDASPAAEPVPTEDFHMAGATSNGLRDWAPALEEEDDWLDRPGRPPSLEETRPYGRPGGLAEPDPQSQVRLAQAVGGRFPDPRGTWIRLINAEGPTEDPFRATNALDCSLAVMSTWHGEPVVAARRYPEYDTVGRPLLTGEIGGVARAEEWLGHRFEYVGHGRRAYVAIAQRLVFGGHGASAVLITRWPTGGSHAWNAVNCNGEVLWIDAQRGHMAVEPPYEEVTGVFSVVIDRHGQRL
ncbi:toxin glutamine deamidase domain-containing protein [Sphaerimonospora thailandensis]|uniref:Tox-PL domain-containing protein n=1 Tax=Sphaerimonospora thailandensis TaxID=795644 RepID=A0A8J3RB06_9ACTN|nr:toxin glutamine deamidase domain-containing protein [Sphaerimonospora thailandensis]GIH70587.1 hypothetical protein Mth01_28400 [Sphaerimonospora thailandensis]